MNTNQLTDRMSGTARELQDTARNKVQDLKETAMDWTGKAKNKARDVGAAADLYLHQYAWTTLAVVGVSALIAGLLLGRKKS
jgi:ElaB/YqjD/DUF883 family membrane-anchored ribosome-binding protein